MNNDQDFSDLRRLLALKKHEQPPPGYFNRLPGKILERIETSDLGVQSTWWGWLVARFDARPILACAYGFTISTLLLMGFRLSQALDSGADADPAAAAFGGGWLAATPDPSTAQPNAFLRSHFANPAALVNFSSVEPVVDFSAPRPAKATSIFQPVSYTFGK